ncbi:MAG TPA: hypothetical protein VNV17_09545 [Solirubrobacteraceae bacterium]|jgi:hypothetical protein|nr:hypothetical protein [Solirubrobacteraceae bacterium]
MRPVILAATALLCALALAACGGSSSSSSAGTGSAGTGTSSAGTGTSGAAGSSSASQPAIGFEGVPLQTGPALAPASTTGTSKVDGISCGASEQLVYHIHAHLAVFKNGQAYTLPAGVGIPGSQAQQTNQGPIASGGSCIYWLHTHTTDGVIHIESPSKAIYTLGNFFDEWHQPLSETQVAGLSGKVTAFVNGKPWKKSPRDIPLLPHADIQLEIGEPSPPIVNIDWSQTQL